MRNNTNESRHSGIFACIWNIVVRQKYPESICGKALDPGHFSDKALKNSGMTHTNRA